MFGLCTQPWQPANNYFSSSSCKRLHKWSTTVSTPQLQTCTQAHAQFGGICTVHLRKSSTAQPHAESQAVSARRSHHTARLIQDMWTKRKSIQSIAPIPRFNPTTVPESTTLHFNYTGALPERCSSGTLYFMVACWGITFILRPCPV